VYQHASAPVLTNATFMIGSAGTGGRGGLRGGTTHRAPAGDHGKSGEVSQ
jgi:hypothetical protein